MIGASSKPGLAQSAIWLVAGVFGLFVLLSPIALMRTDSGSIWGLLGAAGICLAASLFAEGIAVGVQRLDSPNSALAAMVLGMGIRMALPLSLCVLLAVRGQSGNQHFSFIIYLLLFYVVTLAIDTALAVRRTSQLTR